MKFQIVLALVGILTFTSCQDNTQVKGIDFEVTKEFSKEELNNQLERLSKLVNKAIEKEKEAKIIGGKIISLMANSPLDQEGSIQVVSRSISNSSLSDLQKSEIYDILHNEFDYTGLPKVFTKEDVQSQMENLSKLIGKSIKNDKVSGIRNKRIVRFIKKSNLDSKLGLKVFFETLTKSDLSKDDQKALFVIIERMLMD
ncbi:MAG: hypothetical protein QNK65_05035 [Flavobacteriales bacterium]|tara:strand:- start:114 stop:710 length:597 start_codon:yes stop_codon:yes gene_type:complete